MQKLTQSDRVKHVLIFFCTLSYKKAIGNCLNDKCTKYIDIQDCNRWNTSFLKNRAIVRFCDRC